MTGLIDNKQRQQALDIKSSFLVQAPAGSGKTYLLISRYLRALLTVAESAQEVVAITFTNKAAEEMRSRVAKLLNLAKNTPSTNDEQLLLAKDVYELDKKKNLGILSNPKNLLITTIDALCQRIISMNITVNSKINPNPVDIYESSVVEMLSDYHNKPWQYDTVTVLDYLNNNYDRLKELLIELLSERDIWLPYITTGNITTIIENNLKKRTRSIVDYANENLSTEIIHDLKKYLAIYLASLGDNESVFDLEKLGTWQNIADLLLTKQNTYRKSASASIGIIAPSSAKNKVEKEELQTIKESANKFLQTVSTNQDLLQALILVRNSPAQSYEEYDHEIISSLMTLLTVVVAYLNVNFADQNEGDFIAKQLECSNILGELDTPSEFCLNFSNKIKHLLVDEFQDTSLSQLNLIKKLMSAWEANDNKTLFFVGDPMQSIYRFRQADVAIFTSLINGNLLGKKLNFIQLKTNFRSDSNVITWTNYICENLLNKSNVPYSGNVPFNAAYPARQSKNGFVNCFILKQDISNRQNDFIVARIKELQNKGISDIAILARSRNHIKNLVACCNANDLKTCAAEIESLAEESIFIDIANLWLALSNKHDDLSWASLLRSPLCGISLKSLHFICTLDKNKTTYETIFSSNLEIDKNCLDRLYYFKKTISKIYDSIGFDHPAIELESSWLALGGANLITSSNIDKTINNFFADLSSLNKLPSNWQKWEQLLRSSYIVSDNLSNIKIMTIHKSKGLEFEHVILPSFADGSGNNKSKLLNWHQGSITDNDLILGAIPKHKDDFSSTHNYLKYIENLQSENESNRLLYVAATRAKNSIDIIASCEFDSTNTITLKNNKSFLHKTWELINTNNINKIEFIDNIAHRAKGKSSKTQKLNLQAIIKLSSQNLYTVIPLSDKPEFTPDTTKQIHGRIIHSCIEQLSNNGLKFDEIKSNIKVELFESGIANSKIQQEYEYITSVIDKCLLDSNFNWIMSKDHNEARNEYAVSTIEEGRLSKLIIDRTFVCKNNIRWIIDYKLASPINEKISDFVAKQENIYRSKLIKYAEFFKNENREIKLALYFPLCTVLHEIDYI